MSAFATPNQPPDPIDPSDPRPVSVQSRTTTALDTAGEMIRRARLPLFLGAALAAMATWFGFLEAAAATPR